MREPTIEEVNKMKKCELDEEVRKCITSINMALIQLEKYDIVVSDIILHHTHVLEYEGTKQYANMQGFMPTVDLKFTTDKWDA